MRKLIVVVALLIPFLLGCAPEKEEFYGVRFEHNGYQFELPPSAISLYNGYHNVYVYYPAAQPQWPNPQLTNSELWIPFGPSDYTGPLNIGSFTLPIYDLPYTCVGNVVASFCNVNISINTYNELEATFECYQTYTNTCDTSLIITNSLTNGYIHKKNS